jgi:hypothetical protein
MEVLGGVLFALIDLLIIIPIQIIIAIVRARRRR